MRRYLFSILIMITAALTLTGCLFRAPSVQPTFDDYNAFNQKSLTLPAAPAVPPTIPPAAPGDSYPSEKIAYQLATLKTNLGDITFKFRAESPQTVMNFIKLSQNNFYNGVKFHRVIKDFMAQTGDPNSKDDDWSDDGRGGPGYQFADEINQHKLIRGSVAMANAGPNTNGSQFFIVTASATPWLDGKHTNFGQVTDGWDILDKIEQVKTDSNDHPLEDIIINSIELK